MCIFNKEPKEFIKVADDMYIDQFYNTYRVMEREELEEELRKSLTIIPDDEDE